MSSRALPTNIYVGIAKTEPDSRTPRRFTTVMMMTRITSMSTTSGPRDGKSVASAWTPAEMLTETVST